MTSTGTIYEISISRTKGNKKSNIGRIVLKEGFGIVGDAHAGSGRQVSLLPFESFEKIRGKLSTIAPGDFAENITTVGLDFSGFRVGDQLLLGSDARLKITQIGKECHHNCDIRKAVGDCIMPTEGVFAEVIKGGVVSNGDRIGWLRV